MFRILYAALFTLILASCATSPVAAPSAEESEYNAIFTSIYGDSDANEYAFDAPDADKLKNAVTRLEPLAASGYSDAANLLGNIYGGAFGDVLTPDLELAITYFKAALDTPDQQSKAAACVNLAWALMQSDPNQDEWLEIREYAACARQQPATFATAAKPLAFSYLFGTDQDTEIGKAGLLLVEWVDANPDDGHSAYLLAKGQKYGWYSGQIGADDVNACDMFRQASELEEQRAYWETGMCYLNGGYGQQDEEAAFEWVMRAAEQDIPDGLISAAVMHAVGQGTAIDPEAAAGFYDKAIHAANTGSSLQGHAMRGLGGMHYTGEVSDNDPLMGVALISLGDELGDEVATGIMKKLGVMDQVALDELSKEKQRLRAHYGLPAE